MGILIFTILLFDCAVSAKLAFLHNIKHFRPLIRAERSVCMIRQACKTQTKHCGCVPKGLIRLIHFSKYAFYFLFLNIVQRFPSDHEMPEYEDKRLQSEVISGVKYVR